MDSVLERLTAGARVCVIRLRSLGDCVLTTPALALLKRQRPDLKLAVVSEPRFAEVFQGNPDIEEVLPPKLRDVRRWRSALCLNFHGGARSAWMTLASGAEFRAGFLHHRWASVYNVLIPSAQEILNVNRKVHTAEHLASAMFFLGVEIQDVPRARLVAEPAQTATAAGPSAVIHPFASAPGKTWPVERFVRVAQELNAKHGLEPIFLAGPGDDATPFDTWRVLRNAPLPTVKRTVAAASLFVGNDSGPAHMAAAFNVPVVVLFGASDPVIWGPWKTDSAVLTRDEDIEAISVEETLAAIDRLRLRHSGNKKARA
jgi:ADP-heptose:LPS heptosyltransferase